MILVLQQSCLNLSLKSKDCLLLTVRVPDLKAIKPTWFSTHRIHRRWTLQQQQETSGDSGGRGRSGSRSPEGVGCSPHCEGLWVLLRALQPQLYTDSKSWGSLSTCGRARGGRIWGWGSENTSQGTSPTAGKGVTCPERNLEAVRKDNSCWVQNPCTPTTGGRS